MSPQRRKAAIALGICLVSAVMLLETVFAHHRLPNAASPYIWAVLGVVAAVSLACHLWFRLRPEDRQE